MDAGRPDEEGGPGKRAWSEALLVGLRICDKPMCSRLFVFEKRSPQSNTFRVQKIVSF